MVVLSILFIVSGCGRSGAGDPADDCWVRPEGGELVATFTTAVGSGEPVPWYYWRTPTEVGRFYPARQRAEVWSKTDAGVTLERWYVDDKRVVLQPPDELRPLVWDDAGQLVDPSVLAQLAPRPSEPVRCLETEGYGGMIAHRVHNVDWVASLQLPSRYDVGGAGPPRSTVLVGLGAVPALTAIRAARPGYTVLRASELEAEQDDPFVQKILARPGTNE